MKSFKFIVGILTFIVLCQGCANRSPIPIPTPNQLVDLKVGVIADTQITTPYVNSGYLFRNMRTDALVNVAIRTSAQEHLAKEHLRIMLDAIEAKKPDLIVYLGDAANSGCDDEINDFIEIMTSFRKKSKTPVFLTIGNHDYLATGNQADVSAREQACGPQGYYTKAKLVEEFSKYNVESSKLNAFAHNYQVSSFLDVVTDSTSNIRSRCSEATAESKQHSEGCFYSGIIELKSEGKKDINVLLADTSDYTDVKTLPKLSEYFAFFGLRGSISWNSGQTDWFERYLDDSDNMRIISSHYPVTNLGWTRFFTSRPGDLMSDTGYNLWLSAHTHTPLISEDGNAIRYGRPDEGFKTVHHLNVGSTTDYRPHAAIVNMEQNSVKMIAVLSMSDAEISNCKSTLYSEYGGEPAVIEDKLGLTKAYREEGYDTAISRRNIDEFLSEKDNNTREYWVRCLINIGAINEYE